MLLARRSLSDSDRYSLNAGSTSDLNLSDGFNSAPMARIVIADQNLENRIRERAYEIWAAHGCMHGQAEQHWLAAEREIMAASPAALAGKIAPKKKQRSQARSKTVKTLAMAG